MTNIRLNLIVIRFADMERAAQFYRALGLSFEQHQHGNGAQHYSAQLNGTVFEIYPSRDDSEDTSSVRIGFRVQSLEKVVVFALEAGGRIISAPQQSEWGLRAVLDDPDGHRVELTEAIPE